MRLHTDRSAQRACWIGIPGLVGIIAIVLLPVGCGRQGELQKVIVSGKISYAGAAVENGQIYFYPKEGTKGPVSGAPIKDGVYRAEAKGGVPVGVHLVKIEGYRSRSAARDGDVLSGAGGGAPEQYIPAKYNRATQLEVTVLGDQRKITHNFDLAD